MLRRLALLSQSAAATSQREEQAEPEPCRPGGRGAARRCKGAARARLAELLSTAAAWPGLLADAVHAHATWALAAIGLRCSRHARAALARIHLRTGIAILARGAVRLGWVRAHSRRRIA